MDNKPTVKELEQIKNDKLKVVKQGQIVKK